MSEALQSGSVPHETAQPTPLHLFAAVLIGTPFELGSARVIALVAYAQREAAQRIASGRAAVAKDQLLPYIVLYRELRTEASRASPPTVPKSASVRRRVLAAVGALRHRQRAALILKYAAGFFFDEIGEVLGTTASRAEEIVHAAGGRVSAAVGRPVDLTSSLRVRKPAKAPTPKSRAAPVRMPRSVVRVLVAPPPEDTVTLPPAATPVETIIAAHPAATVVGAEPSQPRKRSSRGRLLLAAAVIGVLTLALIPVAAVPEGPRDARRTSPAPVWQVNLPVVTSAAAVVRTVTVRRGDTLWAIAARVLGDPERWRDLWSYNLGRVMATGQRLVDPDVIRPGWILRLPGR